MFVSEIFTQQGSKHKTTKGSHQNEKLGKFGNFSHLEFSEHFEFFEKN